MQIFSSFQGSEAQRTTDLLLLRFSSHWPHPLSFNRFAFISHAALPLFTFCLFPHVQNVRLLLYLCSRFLRFGFLSLCTGTFLKAYLSLSSHFPEAEEHLKLRLCKYCLKSFLRAFLSPLRNTFRALNRFDLLMRLF